MRPWTASQQNGHTNKNNEDWEASQAALKISQFLITAFTDKSLPTKAQGAVDTSSPTKQNRPTLFGKTTHRTSNSYTKKTSNLFTYLHNHSSSSTGATSVLQLLLLSSNSLFSHSSKHYRKKWLPISCEFMHFPTKIPLGNGGGFFDHPHPCITNSHVIIPITWDPSNHSYPSHLSIHDSNGIDPTTLNPSHLFNHNGNGLCVLSNQISLSLSYAKVFW